MRQPIHRHRPAKIGDHRILPENILQPGHRVHFSDCQKLHHVHVNFRRRSARIDDAIFAAMKPRLPQVILAHLLMIIAGAKFDAVHLHPCLGVVGKEGKLRPHAGRAYFDRQIEDDRQVRPALIDRDLPHRENLRLRQTISPKLIGKRAGNEAVADDGLPRVQRRLNDLFHHLCPSRHV